LIFPEVIERILPGGAKSGEIKFYPLKTKKKLFCWKFNRKC